jgi:hypothetical protein
MDHDCDKENWSRPTNRYTGCVCPAWRYNPSHPKPTDPNCQLHGEKQNVQDFSTTEA